MVFFPCFLVQKSSNIIKHHQTYAQNYQIFIPNHSNYSSRNGQHFTIFQRPVFAQSIAKTPTPSAPDRRATNHWEERRPEVDPLLVCGGPEVSSTEKKCHIFRRWAD